MNETLIFFKIGSLLKKCNHTEAVFTKTKLINVNFLQNKKHVLKKAFRLKLYLPKQKWIMTETLTFFKTRSLLIKK